MLDGLPALLAIVLVPDHGLVSAGLAVAILLVVIAGRWLAARRYRTVHQAG